MSIIIDIVFVLFLVLVFYLGYRKGFLTKAWWLVDLALIAIVGFLLSPTIFNAIKNNTGWYTGLADSLASFEDNLNIQAEEIAEFIIRLGIWIVLGIAVIIVMAIVKWLLRKLSCYKAFEIIDKIFGGVYSVLITAAIFLVIGALVGTFDVFGPVAKASDFCADSYVFRYIFGANPFQNYFDAHLPLGTWLQNIL